MNHKMVAHSRNDAKVTGCSDNTELISEKYFILIQQIHVAAWLSQLYVPADW